MTGPLPVLCQITLNQPALQGIAIPAYQRDGVVPGVVHLGLGAFNRAHQALVFDDLLACGDARWGVLGVATRSLPLADTLAAQDGLYAVKLANATGASWRVVGSLLQTCAATREPERVHAAIASLATRWVTLTVTEKGYDARLATLLVEGLRQRCHAGFPGLTIVSCDNLSRNGDKLKALCLESCADPSEKSLADWIAHACRFPNSMVDRIVPAATPHCAQEAAAVLGVNDRAALFSEVFWQWIIEDNFVEPGDGPVLARVGVTVVPDVGPYEDAKLRMLNGSHSALACLGALMGLPTVFDCVSQPTIRRFIFQLMSLEVMPHLARPDLPAYRDALLARFGNPEIKHDVHQIATDSSKKIGLRWLPSILAQLKTGGLFEHHAFAAAAWMRYCLGRSDQDQPYLVNDPQAALMLNIARGAQSDVHTAVKAFMRVDSIWGQTLLDDAAWNAAVERWLHAINTCGTRGALQIFIDQSGGR